MYCMQRLNFLFKKYILFNILLTLYVLLMFAACSCLESFIFTISGFGL